MATKFKESGAVDQVTGAIKSGAESTGNFFKSGISSLKSFWNSLTPPSNHQASKGIVRHTLPEFWQ